MLSTCFARNAARSMRGDGKPFGAYSSATFNALTVFAAVHAEEGGVDGVDLACVAVGFGQIELAHFGQESVIAARFGVSLAACRLHVRAPFGQKLIPPCCQLRPHGRMAGCRLCSCCRHRGHRTTSTGTFEWVSTFWVSLPRRNPAKPLRPCEDMTIRSHFCLVAVLMMAS